MIFMKGKYSRIKNVYEKANDDEKKIERDMNNEPNNQEYNM